MSRTILRRLAPSSSRLMAASILLAVGLTACATDGDASGDPTDSPTSSEGASDGAVDASGAFPVTITHDGGELTFDAAPMAIVSLSPTATEMLFAIGAGDLVVAADAFSTYPPEAPLVEELSGYQTNVEAVLTYEPDLVIASGDSNDMIASFAAVGVPVLLQGTAVSLADAYRQISVLGSVTGFATEAAAVNQDIETALSEVADVAAGTGLSYYHELSTDLYSVTSSTFIGEIYGLFGLDNIADPADADGSSFGYPQLGAEFIADADPDLVFLACTKFCAETAETFAARDGFGGLSAVTNGNVIELDDDVASRWGPRIVDFAEAIAKALAEAR